MDQPEAGKRFRKAFSSVRGEISGNIEKVHVSPVHRSQMEDAKYKELFWDADGDAQRK